ncbi:MAG: hypothetical protein OXC46_05495 [Thaumarchaeota archaeon]|nr:hypothetical protein [Nitrososphaerota archaeon]
MIVIIPDTNVIVASSIKAHYEGTYKLNIPHKFHDESSQLFDIIKDKEYPKVKGILLEKVKSECLGALTNAVRGSCEYKVVEDVVMQAMKTIIEKLEENKKKNEKEIKVLKAVCSEIPNTIKWLRKELSDKKLMNLEKAVENTWKNAMRKVMYDKCTIVTNSSKLNNLWWKIDEEATKWKNDKLNELCDDRTEKIRTPCVKVMISLFKVLETPKLDYNKVCSSLELVNECFDELITKNKNSKQVIAHIKSEKGGHSHKPDKRILAQASTYKGLVDDPESKDYIPNCEIYIASNDRKFFSPYRGDSTITDAIRTKFKIICDSPKEIVGIVKKSKDNT